jgi:hypothetical protein
MRALVIGLLFVAGCGKCCESDVPTPISSSTSSERTAPSCCEVEPSRAAILAGNAAKSAAEQSDANDPAEK